VPTVEEKSNRLNLRKMLGGQPVSLETIPGTFFKIQSKRVMFTRWGIPNSLSSDPTNSESQISRQSASTIAAG
jgi:hypothetical protein